MKDWQDEQKSVVQSRARWINIGKALAEGRMLLPGKVNDRRYGEWLKACGFDNIEVSTRSDAIWFVGMSRVTLDIPSDMNHPKNIRQWNRDQQVAKPPRPDLDLSEAKVTLNPVDVLGIASMSIATADILADTDVPSRYGHPGRHPQDQRPEAVKGSRLAFARSTCGPGRRRETAGHPWYHPDALRASWVDCGHRNACTPF